MNVTVQLTGGVTNVLKLFTKISLVLLVNIALIEAGSYFALGALKMQGKPFAEIYDPSANIARFPGNCLDYAQTLELHPYLAFVHNRRCSGLYRINNIGLLNQDVDFSKTDFYSIGIFGGSVASQFAGLDTTPQLEELLNGCFTNAKNKPFKVLNFADGAWKQPHQVIALALYGDYIDAAISIEGRNEYFALVDNSLDMSWPGRNYTSIFDRNIFTEFYFKLGGFINGTPLDRSNFLKLSTLLYRQALERRSEISNDVLTQKYRRVNANNSRRYLGFARSFDAIATSKDIYSLFVLQPVPLRKKLSEYEMQHVGQLDYEQQYKEVARILSNADHFLDLTDLFRESEETIFGDNVHFVSDFKFKSFGNYKISLEIIKTLSKDHQIFATDSSETCVARYKTYASPQVGPTPGERAACLPDVLKFCGLVTSIDQALACLQANRSRISIRCNAVLVSHGQ